ncbi:MAG TPA: hypothetical protein VHE81_14680 [Lacipirellulaceae bacterium]|nr:hypothetical protein [Lacipirellulaceae bacterium]
MGTAAIRSSSNIVQRLASFRERFGIKGTIFKSLDAVLHKVLRTYVHRVVWLDLSAVAHVAPSDDSFTFRFLTADEVAEFAKDPSYFIDPSLIEGVRSGREVCFAALACHRLAAFGCYTLGFVEPRQAAGAAMSFPSDVAYMSYGFTHPDFRGFRLHGVAMALALQELAKRGITKLVSIVSWTNVASLKSCERLGYINLGNMTTIGSHNHAIGFYPKAAKQLGVRFGRQAVKHEI